MSLHALPCDVMPEATIQVARAAFPKGNPSMRMRDAFGPISTPPTFATLFSHTGRPAEAPAQLALLTVRPCAEGLSDAQAADAVRARLDGKYALALDVSAPGCDASVLSAFRQRLLTGQAALLLCETMFTRCRAQGLLTAQGRHRTDSTPVLAAIHTLKRLECGGETLRQALHVLATAAPAWRQAWVPAAWFDRSSRRVAAYRRPPERPARSALAEHIGTDGHPWRWAIDAPATPAWWREMPAIQRLRPVWLQQF
jgi:transposase